MPNSIARSETITKLRYAADSAFAMLAGMQLDGFLQRIVGVECRLFDSINEALPIWSRASSGKRGMPRSAQKPHTPTRQSQIL